MAVLLSFDALVMCVLHGVYWLLIRVCVFEQWIWLLGVMNMPVVNSQVTWN